MTSCLIGFAKNKPAVHEDEGDMMEIAEVIQWEQLRSDGGLPH